MDVKPIYSFMEHNEETEEGVAVYGLATGFDLVEALRSPEFVWVAEKLAGAYLRRKGAFVALRMATDAVLGGQSRTIVSK